MIYKELGFKIHAKLHRLFKETAVVQDMSMKDLLICNFDLYLSVHHRELSAIFKKYNDERNEWNG